MKRLLPFLLLPVLGSCFKVLQDQTNTKQITAFSLELPNGTPLDTNQVTVRITATDTIYVTVPAGTNLDGLIPIVTNTGAVLSPPNGDPLNFSYPVTYLVTAQNGTSQSYVVIVSE